MYKNIEYVFMEMMVLPHTEYHSMIGVTSSFVKFFCRDLLLLLMILLVLLERELFENFSGQAPKRLGGTGS